MQGNTIVLPYTASICITLSVISITKAVLEFNVARIHAEPIRSWVSLLKSVPVYLDIFPCVVLAGFFRIASLIFIFGYFNTFGFIPLAVMFLTSIISNYLILKGELDHVPNWLIGFLSVFVPVCFSVSDDEDKIETIEMVKLQQKTFICQSLFSFLIYGGSLAVLGYLINFSQQFQQNPDTTLNNQVTF